MKFAFGLAVVFSSGHALAHDGPLLSMAHADFWGMWLIALAVLLMSLSVAIAVRRKTLPQPPIDKDALVLEVVGHKDFGSTPVVRSIGNA
tara:strand:- start:337 stop:606 length:270 start_codon:yes stop_codon:yes gene_type:complete